MSDALLALHYQNDICHPDGRIPFSLKRNTKDATHFVNASRRALQKARHAGWTIAHVHIAFAQDYSDLPRNCRLFLKTETLGALKRGSWGAAALAGFDPVHGEIVVTTNANSAFRRTRLDGALRKRGVTRINVMGLATQFSVEHTVRDAADIGYRVRLLADCCASGDIDAHRASLRTLTMLADVTNSDQALRTRRRSRSPGAAQREA
ncbi:MAG: cysteine hydrolase [Bradyrhizobiaceae bacterium]|nr:cysteine hydrolase [Bradyrhizobiaceae bacterium]